MDIKTRLSNLPTTSGVYIMMNESGQVIYVGKAKNLKNRVSQYFNSSEKQIKVLKMVENVSSFDYILTSSEADALLLENNLIKKYKPQFNILLKDDKTYPYIKLFISEEYPHFEIVRRVENDGEKYFGAYASGSVARRLLSIIHSVYKIRSCKKNISSTVKRACLNADIERCFAPCVDKTTSNLEKYTENVKKAVSFLQGNDSEVKSLLKEKMLEASGKAEFEKAIIYREQLNGICESKQVTIANISKDVTLDVFGFSTNGELSVISVMQVRGGRVVENFNYPIFESGLDASDTLTSFVTKYYLKSGVLVNEIALSEDVDIDLLQNWFCVEFSKKVTVSVPKKALKKQLVDMAVSNAEQTLIKDSGAIKIKNDMTVGAVKQLQAVLKLDKPPRRMECYDISNISGVDKVASMVVFFDGEKQSKSYRRFIIKTVEGANDFASIYEVVKRRLIRFKNGDNGFETPPDLMVIDGGAIQLEYAKRAMSEVGLNFNMIALAEREEEIYYDVNLAPLRLKKSTFTIRLLQRIRDEAHRFAITYFRNLHSKRGLRSGLLEIEGIGEKRAKALISEFKSVENIKNATEEELAVIVGKDVAERIKNYYSGEKAQ